MKQARKYCYFLLLKYGIILMDFGTGDNFYFACFIIFLYNCTGTVDNQNDYQ